MNCQCRPVTSSLKGFYGLGELVVAPSKFRVGIHARPVFTPTEAELRDCLEASPAIGGISATLSQGWTEVYVLVEGITIVDFSDAQDIGGHVIELLKSCFRTLNASGFDPVVIDMIPVEQTGAQGVQQVTTGQYRQAPLPASSANPVDSIARTLGVGKTEALLVVVGALIVGAIILKRIL